MQIEQFIAQVEDSLYGVDAGTISQDTEFTGLKEWDSLALLNLTDTIDMEYGVLMKKGEIESAGTVLSLFNKVQSRQVS